MSGAALVAVSVRRARWSVRLGSRSRSLHGFVTTPAGNCDKASVTRLNCPRFPHKSNTASASASWRSGVNAVKALLPFGLHANLQPGSSPPVNALEPKSTNAVNNPLVTPTPILVTVPLNLAAAARCVKGVTTRTQSWQHAARRVSSATFSKVPLIRGMRCLGHGASRAWPGRRTRRMGRRMFWEYFHIYKNGNKPFASPPLKAELDGR